MWSEGILNVVMAAPPWFIDLVSWSAQVALLVTVAALLVGILRIRQPRVLLVHWRVLLAICLLLPFLQPWHQQKPVVEMQEAPPTIVFVRTPPSSSPATPRAPWPSFLEVAEILAAAILAGILLRLTIIGLGLLKLRRLRRDAIPIPEDDRLAALFEPCLTLAGAHTEFRVSEKLDSPVTFGFTAPVVLLPRKFLSLSGQFQSAIICHELLHVRRRDWAQHLGEEIVRAVFWFHPAFAWLIGRIRLAREQVVDAEVVKFTQSRKSYIEALLEIADSSRPVAAVPAPPFLAERQLSERVTLMLKEVPISKAKLISSLAVIACSLALVAILAARSLPLQATSVTGQASDAQVASQPGAPLVFSMARTKLKNPVGPHPFMEMLGRNVSGKCIEGAVVQYVFMRPDGKPVMSLWSSFSSPPWHCLAPGATRPVARGFASRDPSWPHVRFRATIDLVVYSDGSRWGAAKRTEQDARIVDRIEAWKILDSGAYVCEMSGAVLPRGTTPAVAEQVGELCVTRSLAARRTAGAGQQPGKPASVGFGYVSGSGGGVPPNAVPLPGPGRDTHRSDLPQLLKIPGKLEAARLVHKVQPVWPPLTAGRMQGTVVFKAIISKSGSVIRLSYVSGPPLLVEAAKEAIEQWKYKPTLLNGEPVAVETTISLAFRLGK